MCGCWLAAGGCWPWRGCSLAGAWFVAGVELVPLVEQSLLLSLPLSPCRCRALDPELPWWCCRDAQRGTIWARLAPCGLGLGSGGGGAPSACLGLEFPQGVDGSPASVVAHRWCTVGKCCWLPGADIVGALDFFAVAVPPPRPQCTRAGAPHPPAAAATGCIPGSRHHHPPEKKTPPLKSNIHPNEKRWVQADGHCAQPADASVPLCARPTRRGAARRGGRPPLASPPPPTAAAGPPARHARRCRGRPRHTPPPPSLARYVPPLLWYRFRSVAPCPRSLGTALPPDPSPHLPPTCSGIVPVLRAPSPPRPCPLFLGAPPPAGRRADASPPAAAASPRAGRRSPSSPRRRPRPRSAVVVSTD